jgi:hypothetical protein
LTDDFGVGLPKIKNSMKSTAKGGKRRSDFGKSVESRRSADGDGGGDFQSLAMGLQQTHTARYQHKAAYDPQKE